MSNRASNRLRIAKVQLGAAILAGFAFTAGPSNAQHLDMLYGIDDGHVKTGATDFDLLQLVPDVRVFSDTFNFNSGQGGLWTDAPGHTSNDSPPGMVGLPDDADLYFDIVVEPLTGRNLSYWDGDGAVSWGPVPGSETVEISRGANLAIADGGTAPVSGFLIATEPSTGGIHRHIDYHLRPTGGAASGIYLVALEASIDPVLAADAVAPSPRFWMVFAYNEFQSTLDTAVAWVEANLDVPDCQDGYDNDGDGRADHDGGNLGLGFDDPGCDGASDESEYSLALACDDGIDNDGDGLADHPDDPGCKGLNDPSEAFQCADGIDNDNDGLIDFPNDPQCASADGDVEASSGCGLGTEIAVLLPLLAAARRRRLLA